MRGIPGGLLVVALAVSACAGDDGDDPGAAAGVAPPIDACDWPMWGYSAERTFATACETALSPSSVGDLERVWFHATDDVVTATPAVVGDTVYVGDWAGVVYALERETGEERWRFQTDEHRNVYAGQIVSSPAVADVGGERLVFIGSGKTLYALDTVDGAERWRHELGEAGNVDEPTEIESSPVVVGDTVMLGYDVHNTPGYRAGLLALDAVTGVPRWDFDPDRAGGRPGDGTGCVDIWSSPSVDEARGLAFAATGNCPTSPVGWGDHTEAMFALDLETGDPVWTYQPHEPNNDDLDFAGSPNLFTIGDRDVVGLGNKDGRYYVLDRVTGEPVWEAEATGPGLEQPGSNFSTGGFIGATAVSQGVVTGGTGVGPCPCAHGIDAETGEIRWQNEEPANTYASAAVADGVVFLGGNDFTLRALDLATGEILWSEAMQGAVAGGSVVSGDDLFAVAGIREPGLDERSETSGVYRFSLTGEDEGGDTTTTSTTAAPAGDAVTAFVARGLPCADAPCLVDFGINDPPPGTDPAVFVRFTADPLRIEVTGQDLGAPGDWVRRGSAAARMGATRFGVFLSERDDDPFGGGGLVCSWAEGEDGCTGTAIPRYAPSYNRLSVLAIVDETTEPTLSDGADRLVRTLSFDPPLRAVEP